MKNGRGIIFTLLLALMSATADEEYRVFKDTQGRSIEATVIRYNEAERTVTIHPRSRTARTVPISVFSEEDQAYIISWSHHQAFMEELCLDISAIEKFDRYNIRRDDYGEERGFYHYFSVTFDNKSSVDLDGLSLQYVIFYQQEKQMNGAGSNSVNQEGTLYRETMIRLPPKSEKEFITDSIRLTEYRVDRTGGSNKAAWSDLDSEMDGIMLKISMRTQNGEILTREITYPDDLDKMWTPETQLVDTHEPDAGS